MDVDEEQGWLKYHYDRILIESSRIITPTLPGCTVVLNGAQVEMLRNAVHYLDRRSTFVSEYGALTYETPDDDDWDAIRAVVADLEEKLMGDLNVPWGFFESYLEARQTLDGVAGTTVLTFSTVPANEIWKVTQWISTDSNSTPVVHILRVVRSTIQYSQSAVNPASIGDWVGELVDITMIEGDYLQVAFAGTSLNDDCYAFVGGYKMVV